MFDVNQLRTTLHQRERGFISQVKQVRTSVLVPLVQSGDGRYAVLFEERAHTLRRQPGEISFPGGHAEPGDIDDRHTALREASEELGIRQSDIDYLGALDVLVAWSGLVVSPFVGLIRDANLIRPNREEVASVFMIDIDTLLSIKPDVHEVPLVPQPSEDFPYHLIPRGRNYAWRTMKTTQLFYQCEGRVIWGLTARILHHFLEIVRQGGGNY